TRREEKEKAHGTQAVGFFPLVSLAPCLAYGATTTRTSFWKDANSGIVQTRAPTPSASACLRPGTSTRTSGGERNTTWALLTSLPQAPSISCLRRACRNADILVSAASWVSGRITTPVEM